MKLHHNRFVQMKQSRTRTNENENRIIDDDNKMWVFNNISLNSNLVRAHIYRFIFV